LKVRVNRKVDITVSLRNKQGDVQAIQFVILRNNDLAKIIDGLVAARSNGQHSKLQMGEYCDTWGPAPNTDMIKSPRESLLSLIILSLIKFMLTGNSYLYCGYWLIYRQLSKLTSMGTKTTSGVSVSSGVGLAHSVTTQRILASNLLPLAMTLCPNSRDGIGGNYRF